MAVENPLAVLNAHFYSCPVGNVPQAMQGLLQSILEFRQTLYRYERQVTYFGTFNAGKSTLLNAIIGAPLLPTNVNRATGVITKIAYTPQPTACVSFRTSENFLLQETINLADIGQYIQLDLSGTTSIPPAAVDTVTLGVPLPLLQHRCILVDTPGLLDNPTLTARTFQELAKSDLAVMVLSADKLLAQREKDAALQVQQLLAGNLVFLINRIDLVEPEEIDEIIQWARTSVQKFGNSLVGYPRIFATSGKQASSLSGFTAWLTEVLRTPLGEQIAWRSRLSILKNYLEQVYFICQQELHTIQTTIHDWEQVSAAVVEARRVQMQQGVMSDRLRLAQLKSELGSIGEPFVSYCRKHLENLIQTDPQWSNSEKLTLCFRQCLQFYTDIIYAKAQASIQQTQFTIPVFDLGDFEPQTAISSGEHPGKAWGWWLDIAIGIAAPISGSLGSWFGKSVLAANVQEKALNFIEHIARISLTNLQSRAEKYIDKLDQSLVEYASINQPKIPNTTYLTAVHQSETYCNQFIKWCENFLTVVLQLKAEV